MKIRLVPIRMDERLTVSVQGDVLVLNGVALDLSKVTAKAPMQPGAGMPWVQGEILRNGKVLEVTLLLPHGADAPEQTRFPADLLIVKDGPVELPPYETPPTEDVFEV